MQEGERRAPEKPALHTTGKEWLGGDTGCAGPEDEEAYTAPMALAEAGASALSFGHMSPLTPPLPGDEEHHMHGLPPRWGGPELLRSRPGPLLLLAAVAPARHRLPSHRVWFARPLPSSVKSALARLSQ